MEGNHVNPHSLAQGWMAPLTLGKLIIVTCQLVIPARSRGRPRKSPSGRREPCHTPTATCAHSTGHW